MKRLRKDKKNVFANIDAKDTTDNKTFWQTIKTFFSDKTLVSDQNTLTNNDEIISHYENIAKTFSDFFSNVVKDLNLKFDESFLNQNLGLIENPALRDLKRYKNHPSIKGIERNVKKRNFSFSLATFTDIEKQLRNLNPKKSGQDADIPTS